MKRFYPLLLAPFVFAIYAMAPADSAVTFATPGAIEALIENANASGVFECGGFDTCGGGHEMVTTSDDGSYQTHDCWPGTIHSGPKCTAMLVPSEQLMDTPPNEVADLVAWNPHVESGA